VAMIFEFGIAGVLIGGIDETRKREDHEKKE
jgi:hypothetical protein